MRQDFSPSSITVFTGTNGRSVRHVLIVSCCYFWFVSERIRSNESCANVKSPKNYQREINHTRFTSITCRFDMVSINQSTQERVFRGTTCLLLLLLFGLSTLNDSREAPTTASRPSMLARPAQRINPVLRVWRYKYH